MGPTIDELAAEYDGRAVIGKLNTDEASNVASHHGISGLPCFLFFRDGREVDRISGIPTKDDLKVTLDRLIGQ